ncbi:MAG: TIM-barrel domain-containing protein [Planctomycetota bacterium]
MSVGFTHEVCLSWQDGPQHWHIEAYGPDCLHVRGGLSPDWLPDDRNVLLPPDSTVARREDTDDEKRLVNGRISVQLDAQGRLRFTQTSSGEVLLEEPRARYNRRLRRLPGSDDFSARLTFAAQPDERFFGLGQYPHGRLNHRGCVLDLQQLNTQVSIPVYFSDRRYGFFWNNPAQGRVELGESATRWVARRTKQVDYFVFAGDHYHALLRRYAQLTGFAPRMPDYATGFWQSRLRYQTQEEVLEVAREYHRRGLPLGVIVLDYFHWPCMGAWDFDPEWFPDPEAMIEELREYGVELAVSVWPTVNPNASAWDELESTGGLVRCERGEAVQHRFIDARDPGKVFVQYYDATNPDARGLFWRRLKDNYLRRGVRVFWLDAMEPDWQPHFDHDHIRYHRGNGEAVGHLYPLLHAKGVHDGLREEGHEEVVTLCRAGWAGSQRYGASIWSGDIWSTFESLRQQVAAGLNMAMSGIPWWNSDIGGFKGGDPTDPQFRELLIRWFQFGCFSPIMRLHGVRLPNTLKTGAPNEVWSFGPQAERILIAYLHLRERLRPYIAQQMKTASETGLPPMRPLFVDFPDDPASYEIADAYLFGPDLLVAPVVHADTRGREVYLPAGAHWTDAWTDAVHDGGQRIQVSAPIDRIPLFLRDDAQLPIRLCRGVTAEGVG